MKEECTHMWMPKAGAPSDLRCCFKCGIEILLDSINYKEGFAEGVTQTKVAFCDTLDYWFKENGISLPEETWLMLFNMLNGRYKELLKAEGQEGE